MAQKRMFDKSVVSTDKFLEMPASTQVLYFHLSMQADDDGFVDNWKSIMRMCGSKEDDLKVLIAKQYIIPFESGIIVIRHWRLNNYLQNDRHTTTNYKEELNLLDTENKVYNLYTDCEHRIEKNSIEKKEIDNNKLLSKERKFKKPTLEEVKAYCLERKNNINPQQFIDFYESKGWKVGKNSMKDWKACVRTWENNHKKDIIEHDKELPTWFDNAIVCKEDEKAIQEMNDLLNDI